MLCMLQTAMKTNKRVYLYSPIWFQNDEKGRGLIWVTTCWSSVIPTIDLMRGSRISSSRVAAAVDQVAAVVKMMAELAVENLNQ